ncbi:MAG: PAS domain S-box protein, partial [Desulfobacteraceae bacterium]|nr:PAS domain S-box protein [Desulfobacteraceae bacterium]
MNDESTTREQLLDELKALRKEVDRFRKAEEERDRYVKELKERAQFLEGVLQASPIVFTITRRKDGRFMLVSPAHGKESGYSPKEVLGKTSLELDMYVNEADRNAFVKVLEETGELNNFELQYRNKDGSVRDVLLFARPLVYAGEECMLTASLPITARKLAEQKLARYRDRLEELVKERTAKMESEIAERKRAEVALLKEKLLFEEYINSLPGLFYVFDEQRFVKWNSAWNRITGYSDEELAKRYGNDFFEGEDRTHIGEQMAKVFREGAGEAEAELVTKDGRRIPCFFTGLRKKLSGKDHLIGLGIDVTTRKQAEEALRESEEKYRTILESIEDGYYEADIAGNLTFFNDSLCKILGYSKDELMGLNYRQYTDEGTAKQGYNVFNKVYTTGRADNGFDWKIIRKNGTRRSVEASVSLRRDAEGEPIGFRGIVRDISEKQGLHAQLQHAQKMEAISTLAGGVAHEFNNALMGIMGNIELLQMDLSEDEGRKKYFEAMKGSGHRMSRLTAQLLAYARGGKYQPRDLKLDGFMIETLPILQHNLSPEVRVEMHFPKNISYIKADYAQMQMVLSAILANSNEAIEDEGLIRITA